LTVPVRESDDNIRSYFSTENKPGTAYPQQWCTGPVINAMHCTMQIVQDKAGLPK